MDQPGLTLSTEKITSETTFRLPLPHTPVSFFSKNPITLMFA